MNYWEKLKRWELHIERAPSVTIVRTLVLVFSVAVVTGAVIGSSVQSMRAKATEGTKKELKQLEETRMRQLLERMETHFYEQSASK